MRGGDGGETRALNMPETLTSEQGPCLKGDMHKDACLFSGILMKWLILLSWQQRTAVMKS